MSITPQDFVSKWTRAVARECQSVQEHFIDLCGLIGYETPMGQDPSGTRFAFEMGAANISAIYYPDRRPNDHGQQDMENHFQPERGLRHVREPAQRGGGGLRE